MAVRVRAYRPDRLLHGDLHQPQQLRLAQHGQGRRNDDPRQPMTNRTITMTDDQCAEICGAIEAFGENLVKAAAISGAAMTTHIANVQRDDAMPHAAKLYGHYVEMIRGDMPTLDVLLAKIHGKAG